MPDMPDGSKYLPGSTRFPLMDMGELAVRLGSVDSYDRRGEVLALVNFAHGVGGLTTALSGVGSEVRVVADPVFMGPFGLQLIGGSTLSRYSRVFFYASPSKVGQWGFEASFSFGSDVESLELVTQYYDGENEHDAAVRILAADWSVQVQKHPSTWVTVGEFGYFGAPGSSFHHLKLVADYATGKYVRVMFGNREVDISEYTLPLAGTPGEYNVVHRVTVVSTPGNNGVVTLGHLLVTGNEP